MEFIYYLLKEWDAKENHKFINNSADKRDMLLGYLPKKTCIKIMLLKSQIENCLKLQKTKIRYIWRNTLVSSYMRDVVCNICEYLFAKVC